MADSKISALSSASTPLAGTEVLPIVQSNTTVKVSVNNLTAGKQVPASKVNIGSGTQTDDVLHIEGALSTTARQRIVNTAASQSSEIRFGDDTNADGGLIIKGGSSYPSYGGANSFIIWNNRNAPITFGTNDANRGEWTSDGNLKIASGNFVIGTAGKGIDFSANSGSVFTQYLEGTYTATATGMTTSPTVTASYVRAGNTITLYVPAIYGTSNDTSFTITGMPNGIRPSAQRNVLCRIANNSSAVIVSCCDINTSGVINIYSDPNGGAFTASGVKVFQMSATYVI